MNKRIFFWMIFLFGEELRSNVVKGVNFGFFKIVGVHCIIFYLTLNVIIRMEGNFYYFDYLY